MVEEYETKWLKFIKYKGTEKKTKKTETWLIHSKCDGLTLGLVEWHIPWRHYCFFSCYDTVFSDRCLIELSQFLTKLNEEHKEKIKLSKGGDEK